MTATGILHTHSIPDGTGFDALITDWDGTVVDSRDLNHRALASALQDCGVALDPDWYWPRQGLASPEMLVLWENEFGPLPEPIETIITRCRAYVVAEAASVTVITEMADIIRAAHQRGQRIAVASNSAEVTLLASMAATGLAPLFHAAASWSDVPHGRGKPCPDIFLLAAQRLGVQPSRCLVYEDADEGVAGALAAGMSVYNVRTRQLITHPAGS